MTRTEFLNLWKNKKLKLLDSKIIKDDYYKTIQEVYRYENTFWGVKYSITDDPQFSQDCRLPWLASDLIIKEVIPIPEIKYYIKDDPDKEFNYDS